MVQKAIWRISCAVKHRKEDIMAKLELHSYRSGMESVVAYLHNSSYAGWRNNLEPCFGYEELDELHISQWVSQPSLSIRVAYYNQEPIAYAGYRTATEHGKQDFIFGRLELTHQDWGQSQLGVLPDYRQQGVGREIVESILSELTASKACIVIGWCYNFNRPACALFERLGFVNQERYYYEPHSEQEPWGYDSIYAELDLKKPLKDIPLNADLTLRAPRTEDETQFLELFRLSAPFAFGPRPNRVDIKRWLKDPNRRGILVGEYNGKVAGVVEYFIHGILGIPGVLPEYRGRGIGSTLLYNLLLQMQEQGISRAFGDTGVIMEDMLHLYERFGFNLNRRLLNWVLRL